MLDGDDCDTLLTEAECEAAAVIEGKNFETKNRTDRPHGCWKNSEKFYFNPNEDYSCNPNEAFCDQDRVCAGAAPLPPPPA